MNSYRILGVLSGLLLALGGCGGDDSGTSGGAPTAGPGATGITQGGAQDFGLFRQILEDGGIPGPDTLEDVGFFAEHKLDYPEPSCGEDLCVHGLVGAMGNMINGASCTVIQIGMNTPIDANALGRPPMHIVLSVDVSGSMAGAPIAYLRAGLIEMIDELRPEDHVSLVTYATSAEVVLEHVSAVDTPLLTTTFQSLEANGATNLYDGLFSAYQLAEQYRGPAGQTRVIFMSDGMATAGLISAPKMRSLVESYARLGVPLSSIGVGTEFDVDVMRQIGEVGAGNFYFLEDPAAVAEVFREEIKTFLYPVALDARIDVQIASGYRLRGSYGASRWQSYGSSGSLEIPSLFVAGRESAEEPVTGGRRGGGGAIILELVPRQGIDDSEPPDVGTVAIEWTHPATGERKYETVPVTTPHAPGHAPVEGYFSNPTVEKGFVMLNIYAAFKIATQLAADSDPRTARRTLELLLPNVIAWAEEHDDADIADDLRYVHMFIDNLGRVIETTQPYEPADPPNPWPAD